MKVEPRRRCGKCGESLPRAAFNRLGDGLQHWCVNCHRRVTARRAGWSRLAGGVDDPRRGFSAPVRRNLNQVHGLLAAGRCVDCGEADMLVLEFDHVGVKRGQISTMAWNVSLEALQRELAACEIRCCNCHRRVTRQRSAKSRSDALESATRPP